ncbi:hypothetical protein [Labilibaculum euxinus]|uniref:Uncharacterized protein n=1 Tax=Labilibaculum euxinus TaxID=2686357 RepID=A0A7M4D0S3_9BACT|nr:hypothetical protein [Labilibaculum euxinus]MUP36252.1 hypothetical protein [Labilibaculum euxinus]MVB05457.1 hypothetical protein [Labilibaculum euxinus]
MSRFIHILSLVLFVLIVLIAIAVLCYYGFTYYHLNVEERFYHPDHQILKPSGIVGHGLGIIGSLLIIIGVFMYMVRKRIARFSRIGILKYWLEFHIFLCSLGPVLILFHTAFKFGGIVSISFWSMVAVVISGIIGRFIYIQIPRTIEGRELSLLEVRDTKTDVGALLKKEYNLNEESHQIIVASVAGNSDNNSGLLLFRLLRKMAKDRKTYKKIDSELKRNKLSQAERKKIKRLVIHEITLNRKIDRLNYMQKLFKYWHVAHLPFALVMLVILLIHVAVTIIFGYKWIF